MRILEQTLVSIDVLRPDPQHARRMDRTTRRALERSLRKHGVMRPIIAMSDGMIIDGHALLDAARAVGMTQVPVSFVPGLSLDQARVLGLSLNRIVGDWDELLLPRLIAELQASIDADISLAGFGDDELQRYLRSLETREQRERPEDFDVVSAMAEGPAPSPRVRTGDLWRLGEHRLSCGDATSAEAIDRLMGGKRANGTFTDPPYNVDLGNHGGAGRKRRPMANDALDQESWRRFVRGWGEQLLRLTDGAMYICMSSKEWPTVSAILDELGAHWSTTLIWAKDRFVLGRADYQRQYEPIWFGWREGATHHWCGDRDQGDLWTIARLADAELHPTMKPLALIERALENSTLPGDLILDPFLGSGSTLIAAQRTGRVCYGMEISPHYCDVIVARWESFTGGIAERESSGCSREAV